MTSTPVQTSLFAITELGTNEPAARERWQGLIYQPEFLSLDEEAILLEHFAQLPFKEARFQQYTARRRVMRYGKDDYPATYGAAAALENPQRPFPAFLEGLRRKVAGWRGMPETAFVHALVTEYRPGTPIGWHRDAPHFELVVGISLAGSARMRFRPNDARSDSGAPFAIELAPRSAYVMQDKIRSCWQHHIPATRELRYSITFRTLRAVEKKASRQA